MTHRSIDALPVTVPTVIAESQNEAAAGRAIRALTKALQDAGLDVVIAATGTDARAGGVFASARIFLVHTRPYRRHRIPKIAGRTGVFRLLWRISVAFRSFRFGRRARLAARPFRPIGTGEAYTAEVVGADRTYYVTNGTSISNPVVVMASVTRGQIALCDRNCHK